MLDADPSSIQSWKSGGNNQKEPEVHPDKVEPVAGSQKPEESGLAKPQESQNLEVDEKPAPEEVQAKD